MNVGARISSNKTFQNKIHLTDLNVRQHVNGFDFAKEVVSLEDGGAVYGKI